MTIIEIGSKWSEKTGFEFFNEFVKFFPTLNDFNNWLRGKGLDPDTEDWYPEGESYEINQLFGFDIDEKDNTDNYCDFFNELCDNGW